VALPAHTRARVAADGRRSILWLDRPLNIILWERLMAEVSPQGRWQCGQRRKTPSA
jgi:hypothetical protein